jgi:signal transduction histidine kinase
MSAQVRRIRLIQAAAAMVGVAVLAESARLAFGTSWYAFGDTSTWSAVLGLAAGAALVVAGTVELGSPASRKSGMLLAAAGMAWLITAWDNPAAPTWIFVAGRILDTGWPVLVAHALLKRYGGLGRADHAVLTTAYVCTIGLDLAVSLVSDPVTSGCADCPANPLLLADVPGIAAALERTATLTGPIWAILLAGALAIRLFRSTSARRRIEFPMTTIGVLLLIVVAAGYVRATVRRLPETDDAALWAAESCLLLLLALATGWPALSLALTRQRVAELVVLASAAPPIGGLGRVLGEALHDPTTRLLYRRQGESDEYLVDADGNPAQPSAQLTPLIRGADTVAYLDHDEPLLDHEGDVIAQVARLSLDHERLHAERTAQLRELRASRVRIVEAADRERRRLERDLHDGAQQRLVSLALGLQLAELAPAAAESSQPVSLLTDAATDVATALAELRAIARGLYPRELADEGLESALETFAESDPTPVELNCDLPDRLPQAVEAAAYFTVAHLLATPSYEPAAGRAIHAWQEGNQLHIELAGSRRTDDLTMAEDRVGALGGTVQRAGAGLIRIVLPCES